MENISDDTRAVTVLESKEVEFSVSAKIRTCSKNENRELSLANRSSTVKVGGKEVEWSKIREVFQTMQLQISTPKKGQQESVEGMTKFSWRRGRGRELKNLEFNV
ncbi:hypothetical protein L484_014969 [Morus notabilis]|uniref:Uncharacterized protein n=1 Tax=Morus notabilis TaxID=981085 RepID=W9SI84_9ROSA|nr:hypothetical protein L484_014969 [Morus notabilis]